MNRGERGPRILIHIEDPQRDSSVLLALGRLFESAGAHVLFSSRRRTLRLLQALPLDAALLSSPDNIPYDAYPRVRRRTQLFMLPTEGAIFEEGPLLLKYAGGTDPQCWDRHIQGIRRFFLWGDNNRRVLLRTGRFPEEKLRVVGAPRMDYFLTPSKETAPKRGEGDLLGIIGSYPLINDIGREPMPLKIDANRGDSWGYQSPARNFEDRLWVEAACFRTLIAFYDECHRRGKRTQMRIHPHENRSVYRYFEDRYSPGLSLSEPLLPFEPWLDLVQAVAGFNSTTFFEAVAARKPAVNLTGMVDPRLADHTNHFPQSHYPIMDHVSNPHSWEELFAFLDRIRSTPPAEPFVHASEAQAILQDVCAFPRPVSALARIVQMVLADLGEPVREPGYGLREQRALAEAKALDLYTFRIRRDPIGNCWFPLSAPWLRRRYGKEVARYVRAAENFPCTEKTPAESAAPFRKTGMPEQVTA